MMAPKAFARLLALPLLGRQDAELWSHGRRLLGRGGGDFRKPWFQAGPVAVVNYHHLHLSFSQLPVPVRDVSTARHDTVTTDLTVLEVNQLGLTPVHFPRGYVNSWSYGGVPVLPGLTIATGILLAALGVSVLMHRRRLTW